MDVTEVLPQLCALLGDFLKKSQRSLKIASLELLKQLVAGNKPARQALLGEYVMCLIEQVEAFHVQFLETTRSGARTTAGASE